MAAADFDGGSSYASGLGNIRLAHLGFDFDSTARSLGYDVGLRVATLDRDRTFSGTLGLVGRRN